MNMNSEKSDKRSHRYSGQLPIDASALNSIIESAVQKAVSSQIRNLQCSNCSESYVTQFAEPLHSPRNITPYDHSIPPPESVRSGRSDSHRGGHFPCVASTSGGDGQFSMPTSGDSGSWTRGHSGENNSAITRQSHRDSRPTERCSTTMPRHFPPRIEAPRSGSHAGSSEHTIPPGNRKSVWEKQTSVPQSGDSSSVLNHAFGSGRVRSDRMSSSNSRCSDFTHISGVRRRPSKKESQVSHKHTVSDRRSMSRTPSHLAPIPLKLRMKLPITQRSKSIPGRLGRRTRANPSVHQKSSSRDNISHTDESLDDLSSPETSPESSQESVDGSNPDSSKNSRPDSSKNSRQDSIKNSRPDSSRDQSRVSYESVNRYSVDQYPSRSKSTPAIRESASVFVPSFPCPHTPNCSDMNTCFDRDSNQFESRQGSSRGSSPDPYRYGDSVPGSDLKVSSTGRGSSISEYHTCVSNDDGCRASRQGVSRRGNVKSRESCRSPSTTVSPVRNSHSRAKYVANRVSKSLTNSVSPRISQLSRDNGSRSSGMYGRNTSISDIHQRDPSPMVDNLTPTGPDICIPATPPTSPPKQRPLDRVNSITSFLAGESTPDIVLGTPLEDIVCESQTSMEDESDREFCPDNMRSQDVQNSPNVSNSQQQCQTMKQAEPQIRSISRSRFELFQSVESTHESQIIDGWPKIDYVGVSSSAIEESVKLTRPQPVSTSVKSHLKYSQPSIAVSLTSDPDDTDMSHVVPGLYREIQGTQPLSQNNSFQATEVLSIAGGVQSRNSHNNASVELRNMSPEYSHRTEHPHSPLPIVPPRGSTEIELPRSNRSRSQSNLNHHKQPRKFAENVQSDEHVLQSIRSNDRHSRVRPH
eukprot:289602_1